MDIAQQPLHLQKQASVSGTVYVLALAVYFVLQVVIRLTLSDSLDLDEAEQVFEFQQLRLGYATQPPLYQWLQWLMFSAFGLNLFALSALKNLLLFGTYLGMFHMARPMIGVPGAIAASASLLLFPQIGWESQRDLTHSVLLTLLACATLWSYFALARHPSTPRYGLFGLLIGLGLQSKYNFAIFITALVIASLLNTEHRRVVWNRKAWIAVAIAILCLLPHGLWLLNNLDTATGATMQKIGSGGKNGDYLHNVAMGLGTMLRSALAFITPLWLIYLVACRRYLKQAAIDWRHPNARFFLFFYAACFALITMVVLTGKASYVKDRWMQPLLFSLPLALFVALPGLAQADVFRRVLRVAALVAVVFLLAIPLRVHLGPSFGKLVRAHYPYPELATELARRYPQARTVVSNDRLLAGNLYFQQPRLRTLLSDRLLSEPAPLEGGVLLVAHKGAAHGWMERFHAAYSMSRIEQRGEITLPYRYGSQETMSFDYAYIVVRSQ